MCLQVDRRWSHSHCGAWFVLFATGHLLKHLPCLECLYPVPRQLATTNFASAVLHALAGCFAERSRQELRLLSAWLHLPNTAWSREAASVERVPHHVSLWSQVSHEASWWNLSNHAAFAHPAHWSSAEPRPVFGMHGADPSPRTLCLLAVVASLFHCPLQKPHVAVVFSVSQISLTGSLSSSACCWHDSRPPLLEGSQFCHYGGH